MIQSTNDHQGMRSTESDNEHLTVFARIRRPFMELSGNMQQLPNRFVATSARDPITNNSMEDTLPETDFYDGS